MFADILINLLASVLLLAGGYAGGKFRERRLRQGKNLEEYDFYPFGLDENKCLYFDRPKFAQAVRYFLRHRDELAARQLIVVGRQNDVTATQAGEDGEAFQKLYSRYDGDSIRDDNDRYLANFKRIVRLIGDSFQDIGIEILLHDLTNPASALCLIKNNVTGRDVGAPATNLVLDLKTRAQNNEDKLNYELNIGSRRFKCTTIPVLRERYGLVGAICINVDVNYLNEVVRGDVRQLEGFFRSLCKTDMRLDENILSREELRNAMSGKRHFRDSATGAG